MLHKIFSCLVTHTLCNVLDSYFTSVQLTVISIQQNIGIFNFMVTQSSDLPITEEYLVTVSPPPPHGPDEVTTISSAIFTLENNTHYTFTIFLRACLERFNRTFVFGTISNTISNYNYNVILSIILCG